jgi:hypothetical protein
VSIGSIWIPVKPESPDISQRCRDLAENISETLILIKEYEELRRLSSEPKETRRATREIEDLRQQLEKFKDEMKDEGCEEIV